MARFYHSPALTNHPHLMTNVTPPPDHASGLTLWLQQCPAWQRHFFAITSAFTVYFCMYAFRKPFAAGSFADAVSTPFGLSFKTSLVIAQIIGYALSKYLGSHLLPGLKAEYRGRALFALVGLAWFALLVFAQVGETLRLVALFTNGLCLGMVWGLVVSFLEGRRASELLLAGLSCSFILASGVVKDVGRWLMRAEGVSEWWMPFGTASLFAPVFVLAVVLLTRLPQPSRQDELERSPRSSMTTNEKLLFLRKFAAPLALLLVTYFFLTAFRDYRDNYGVELFAALGYAEQPALFTATELPVALGVLIVLGALSFVRDNKLALKCVFLVMTTGLLMMSGATLLLRQGLISGATWMVLIGLGSYLTYVPFGSVLFDRIIAHTRFAGTAVFGIYLADALGYTGSVLIQLYSDLGPQSGQRLEFFIGLTHSIAWGGSALTLASAVLWFRAVPKAQR